MWKSRRQKKSFFILAKKISFLIPVLIVSSLFLLIFKSQIFTIKKIEISAEGLGCVEKKELDNSSRILGQNFFLINFSQITANLKKKFICIKSINYSKVFPDQVKLQILARAPKVILFPVKEKEASLSAIILNTATPSAQFTIGYLIDDEGIIFSKTEGGLDILQIGMINSEIPLGEKIDHQIIKAMQILAKVKAFGPELESSWMENNDLLIFSKEKKTKIVFKLDESFNIQLASLQLILSEAKINLTDLEFIDLRFDKPVVRVAPKKHG